MKTGIGKVRKRLTGKEVGYVRTTYLINGVKTVELEADGTPIGHG